MCRFLIVESRPAVRPAELLRRFAEMAEKSRSEDGDLQGDGWGFCQRNEAGDWRGYWSLRPVWEEENVFLSFPAARRFCVHARSSSFPGQTGNLEFNQPFVGGGAAFVFNGLLRGVTIDRRLAGKIGAQKIWNLLRGMNHPVSFPSRMEAVIRILEASAREIRALNLGLAAPDGSYAYCRRAASGEYYRLRAAEAPELRMICSEPLRGFDFRPLPADAVVRI